MSGWYNRDRAELLAAMTWPSEPVLRDEDVDIDDISVGHDTPDHVVHLQLEDGVKRAHDGPHLAHNTHSHAVHVTLDDVEGVPQVPFRYVEDDVGVVGRIRWRDGPEKDDLFRAGELAEGGQRDDGMGDGVHRVQHAGDVVGAAGLDAADSVCLLLAERVCGAAVVLGALEGQAAEAALDVEAGLIDGAVVDAGHTLIDVLAVPAVGGQPVPGGRAAALEASREVDAAVGADVAPGGQSTLVNVLAGDPVHIAELVAPAAVALVGAVDVGALLAAGAAVTLVHVFAGAAVGQEPEAHGAAAEVGAGRVLALVAAQAPGVAPALVDVYTSPADAVEVVTSLALAAEASRGVHTAVPRATWLRGRGALIHVNTAGSLIVEMVATATVGHILLTCVGALRVDACLPHRARGTDT